MVDEAETQQLQEMLARASLQHGVDVDLLTALLALEREFPELPAPQARVGLSQRVAELLDQAASEGP